MVRGPAAVLIAAAAGAAALWAAPALPDPGAGDAGTLIAGGADLVAVVACAAVAVPAAAARGVLWLALPGAAILVAALAVAGIGPQATPAEALAYGAAGTAFAAVLDSPALALVLPLFVAVVDAVSVAAGGPTGLQLQNAAESADALALALPAWGRSGTVASLSAVDVLFAAAFAAYAVRFGLRVGATVLGQATALVAVLAVTVLTDHAVPVLAALALGFVVPNADRLRTLARSAVAG